ncbi:hypothetical protein HK097_007625 [Rhizophlyctis rosea]|uniref:Replication origin-binding protein domain-containing protein n=1 Tax=Rhizophlyctis rosea TaxID=64517 RepID=A0AAD5SDM6_9FUNG|nr:hypothetical protein HK097_007625 [Rhizophlyctis rosea]
MPQISYLDRDWNVDKGSLEVTEKQLKPDEFVITAVLPQKMGKPLYAFTGMTYEELKPLIKKNHWLREMISAGQQVKLYFDIDKTAKSLDEIKERILVAFPDANMHVSGRLGNWHITLSNYYADCVTQMAGVKAFAVANADAQFDTCIYHHHRAMKIINQTKPEVGSQPQKWVDGSKDATKHLILHNFDRKKTNINTMGFSKYVNLAAKVKKESRKTEGKTNLAELPDVKLPLPEDFELPHAPPLERLFMLPCKHLTHNTRWAVMTWCKIVGISFEQFWKWNQDAGNAMGRLTRYTQYWDKENDYFIKDATIVAMLKWFYPDVEIPKSTLILRRQFDLSRVVNGQHEIFNEQYLKAEYIQNAKGKFNFLLSGMGSNKTGSVVDYSGSLPEGSRVLWVAPRITLAQNTAQRLRDAGMNFALYMSFTKKQKLDGALDRRQYVICSIQSLHYLSKEFDCIVFDELETTLDTFMGDCVTHKKNLFSNWEKMKILCSRARKVLCMDAFTTQKSTNLASAILQMTEMGDEPINLINTETPLARQKMLEHPTFDDWFQNILLDLESGKKIYIYASCKKGTKGVAAIEQALITRFNWEYGRHIISYFAEKDEEKRNLTAVNELWSNPDLRCVVTNGCISVGVNFHKKEIFDCVHAFYATYIPPRDFFQALARIRHPKDTTISLYRSELRAYGDYELADLDCNIFKQLQRDLDIERRANGNHKKWETFNLFAEMGGFDIYPSKAKVLSEDLRTEIQKMLADADIFFDFENIPNITWEDVEELEMKILSGRASALNKLSLEKFYWKMNFIDEADFDELKEVWSSNINLPARLRALEEEEVPIMKRLLEENKLTVDDFGEGLPDTMHTSIPLTDIQKFFNFAKAPETYRTDLVAKMLNAYFQCEVYRRSNKRKQKDGKRDYVYETNNSFMTAANTVLHFLKRKEPEGTVPSILDMEYDSEDADE